MLKYTFSYSCLVHICFPGRKQTSLVGDRTGCFIKCKEYSCKAEYILLHRLCNSSHSIFIFLACYCSVEPETLQYGETMLSGKCFIISKYCLLNSCVTHVGLRKQLTFQIHSEYKMWQCTYILNSKLYDTILKDGILNVPIDSQIKTLGVVHLHINYNTMYIHQVIWIQVEKSAIYFAYNINLVVYLSKDGEFGLVSLWSLF